MTTVDLTISDLEDAAHNFISASKIARTKVWAVSESIGNERTYRVFDLIDNIKMEFEFWEHTLRPGEIFARLPFAKAPGPS